MSFVEFVNKTYKKLSKDMQEAVAPFFIFLPITLILFAVRLDLYHSLTDALYSFVHLVSEMCFIYWFLALVFNLYDILRRKFVKPSKNVLILYLVIFLLSLPHLPIVFGFRTTQIDGFYEGGEYTERYYVVVSKDPSTVINRQAYYLPAEISRTRDAGETYETETFYGDIKEHQRIISHYHINSLFFPNGNIVTFDYENIVAPGKETQVSDVGMKTYYITLTTNKVRKEV